jgi:hypothetical protein
MDSYSISFNMSSFNGVRVTPSENSKLSAFQNGMGILNFVGWLWAPMAESEPYLDMI